MFLVKREELRSFDVFFGGILVFVREKKRVERLCKKQTSEKMWSPLVFGVPGAIYSPGHTFQGGGHYRAAASNSS